MNNVYMVEREEPHPDDKDRAVWDNEAAFTTKEAAIEYAEKLSKKHPNCTVTVMRYRLDDANEPVLMWDSQVFTA